MYFEDAIVSQLHFIFFPTFFSLSFIESFSERGSPTDALLTLLIDIMAGSASQELESSRNGSDAISKDDDEKHAHRGPVSLTRVDMLGQDDEIVYHYLTHETPLPQPRLANKPSTQDVPNCPDLSKWTSPFLWSNKRKSILTWISVGATCTTAYSAGAYTAAIPQMRELWGISEVAALVGVTVFVVGFGIAPMVLAPFSEINGRKPMFTVTGVLFVVFQIICAVTPTFSGMLVARFLVGCTSSTFSTMVGGVVADIYHAEDRNTAMVSKI